MSEGRQCGAECLQTKAERGRNGGGSDQRCQGEEGEGDLVAWA
jgi:hypothetical protein